jgi:hypothetical protein
VGDALRPVSLARPTWIADGAEDRPGALGAQYAVVLITAD